MSNCRCQGTVRRTTFTTCGVSSKLDIPSCKVWAFVKLSLEFVIMLCNEILYLFMIIVLTSKVQDGKIVVHSLGICISINAWEGMILMALYAAIRCSMQALQYGLGFQS